MSGPWPFTGRWTALQLFCHRMCTRIWKKASCNPAIPIEAGGNYAIIHGETGNMLAGVPYKKGLRVLRSKMRKLCGNGIDVQYGKQLSRIEFDEDEQGVTVGFTDGTSVSGTLVVGADGARSKVREVAMGSAERAATTPFPIWHMDLTVLMVTRRKCDTCAPTSPPAFWHSASALSTRSSQFPVCRMAPIARRAGFSI
ncbi:MAG: hypothetical protein LQ349_008879 [Xanthoria aureola]|nr:MAG: hypothetical protein LQ349_008879 [Xanthoria aureola]